MPGSKDMGSLGPEPIPAYGGGGFLDYFLPGHWCKQLAPTRPFTGFESEKASDVEPGSPYHAKKGVDSLLLCTCSPSAAACPRTRWSFRRKELVCGGVEHVIETYHISKRQRQPEALLKTLAAVGRQSIGGQTWAAKLGDKPSDNISHTALGAVPS